MRGRWGLRTERARTFYNRREYQRVLKILSKGPDDWRDQNSKACSMIARSLFNLGRFDEVKQYLNGLEARGLTLDDHLTSLAERTAIKLRGTIEFASDPEWEFDVDKIWSVIDGRLILTHPRGRVGFTFPPEFDPARVSRPLLELAALVLLHPFIDSNSIPTLSSRQFGGQRALAYSGGIDSTAAMVVMGQDVILGYHRRDFPSLLRHENAEHIFRRIREVTGQDVHVIESDHELIRTRWGHQTGFSTDYAAGVHLILLADQLDLGSIAFGSPLDNIWMRSGRFFRQFEETVHWSFWRTRFSDAGLRLEFPIARMSEASCMKVVQASRFRGMVNSCLRSDKPNQGCMRCWKCLMKNAIHSPSKIEIDSEEIRTFLAKRPLKTGTHAYWVLQELGELERVNGRPVNLEWWTKLAAHLPSIGRDYAIPGLDVMTGDDISMFRTWNVDDHLDTVNGGADW